MQFKKPTFKKHDAFMASICILTMLVVMVEPAFAQVNVESTGGFTQSNIGTGVLNVGTDVLFGNLGLLAGIFFAAFGAYQWLVAQNTWVGIGSIIFGAVLALSDNLMTAVYNTIATPFVDVLNS